MTMQTALPDADAPVPDHPLPDTGNPSNKTRLLHMGMSRFLALGERIEDMQDSLDALATLAPVDVQDRLQQLSRQLQELEPSVTLLGQVKSGKTTLLNAMMARPDLLPSDVNPWTTVVTSVHLNAPRAEDAPVARFQFFSPDEWTRMASPGTKFGAIIGAPASRSTDGLRSRQTARERTKLARRFELLLGQAHSYNTLSEPLIESYVCQGDEGDPTNPDAARPGRFADITKAADLYVDVPEIPVALCLRDTPGVNDSVLSREHLTIEALRDSRICLVVLSAHQALSSVDLALMRLIANIPDREIILFVNRIDELSAPAREIPEIYDSLLATLSKFDGPVEPSIIFGSADWANIALREAWQDLSADSADALYEWGNVALDATDDDLTPTQMVWKLSGIPALYDAIGARVVVGPGREALNHTARRAVNIVQALQAADQPDHDMPQNAQVLRAFDLERLDARLLHIEEQARTQLTLALHRAAEDFTLRVDQSHARFLNRATEALLQHLERQGENVPWSYSPQGLRMLLRSSHQALARRTDEAANRVFVAAAEKITAIYTLDLGLRLDGFAIEPPAPPAIPAPVGLGQTISLDVSGSWWARWWRRRKGYRVFSADFRARIAKETAPIVSYLTGPTLHNMQRAPHDTLEQFLGDQRAALMDVASDGALAPDDLDRMVGGEAMRDRAALLNILLGELKSYVHLGASDSNRVASAPKAAPQKSMERVE